MKASEAFRCGKEVGLGNGVGGSCFVVAIVFWSRLELWQVGLLVAIGLYLWHRANTFQERYDKAAYEAGLRRADHQTPD